MYLQSVTVVAYKREEEKIKPIYLNENTPLTSDNFSEMDIIFDLHDAIAQIIEEHILDKRQNKRKEEVKSKEIKKNNDKAHILIIWFHWYYPSNAKDVEKKIHKKLKELCDKFEPEIKLRPPIINDSRVFRKRECICIVDSDSKRRNYQFKTLYVRRP